MASPLRRQVTVPAIGRCPPPVRNPFSLSRPSVCVSSVVFASCPISHVARVSPISSYRTRARTRVILRLIFPSWRLFGWGAHSRLEMEIPSPALYFETILTIKGRCGAQSQNLLDMVPRRRRFGAAYETIPRTRLLGSSVSLPPPLDP